MRTAGLVGRGTTAFVTLALLAACSTDTVVAPPEETPPTQAPPIQRLPAPQARAPEFVPGEVLVRFRAGVGTAGRGRALQAANATAAERILTAAMRRAGDDEGVQLVRTGLGVPDAIARLQADPSVEYAEPNWIYTVDATSNDTYFTNSSLWGMYGSGTSPANQYGSGAAAAWTRGADCSGVYVGIIDEGYMYTHEDLAANAATVPGEVAGNGVDDDGNGYADDVHGYDFANDDASVFDGSIDDHGTHVAGTIGGVGGNGKGVAGVCHQVKLLNAKFLGRNGGTTANAVKAVDYFTDLKTRGVNLVATSNSWGGGGYSKALEDAIKRANSAGVLFVAAAGNSAYNCDTSTSCYPAEYAVENVIAVASHTSSGALSSFTNYGATTVDISAPGSGIWSTVPRSSKGSVVSGYASYSGTSMATPHVSGAAALYKARNGGATAGQIKSAILDAALPSSFGGRVASNRRLDVSRF